MHEPGRSSFARPREDIVISLCLSDLPVREATFATIRQLAARLDAAYRFREIILVVDEARRADFLPLVEEIADVRLFVVRKGTEYYQRRVIAAEEAIGDVVVIGNVEELAHMDLLGFIAMAETSGAITLAHRSARRPVKDALSLPFVALGRLAGFKVHPGDFQTMAMPRSQLNTVLAHEEPRLSLRFPPRDARLALACFPVDVDIPSRSARFDIGRRAMLLQNLLVYLTPAILSLVMVSSALLALVGIAYGAYILGAVVMVEALAPGWLTTNVMLAVTAVFMGLSMLGLSLGLQHLLRQNSRRHAETGFDEVNRIDLFRKVASDLNVEVESEPVPLRRGEG
jgi:hypothetical protein